MEGEKENVNWVLKIAMCVFSVVGDSVFVVMCEGVLVILVGTADDPIEAVSPQLWLWSYHTHSTCLRPFYKSE